MANTKIQATAQLFLDTSNAKNDAKKFVADLKQQLSSVETAADKMNVFKELVGLIAMADKNLSALADKVPHMFDGLDSAFHQYFEDLFGISGENLKKFDELRDKISSITKGAKIEDVRKLAKEVNNLFTFVGQEAPINVDEIKRKVTSEQIDGIKAAFANFENLWSDMVSGLKDKLNLGGIGIGSFSEGVQEEIRRLQGQLSELKSFKQELDSTFKSVTDYSKGKDINLKVDISQIEKLIEEYKRLDEVSKKLQYGTEDYYNNLMQRAKIGLQLYSADSGGKLGEKDHTKVTNIIDTKAFENVLSTFEKEFSNMSVTVDQMIVGIQQKIKGVVSNVLKGDGSQGEARQLLKTYDELLKIVDKLSAFSLDEIDFDDEKVVNLIKTLKDLYATEEQFADVDSIVQSIFNAEIDSPEGLERLKTLFGIEIPDSIQTAEEKYQSFKDRIESEGFTDELSAGQYLSEMESLRNELQSLYEQGRITRDQFDEIDEAFNENVKGQVDAFKNKLNVLKELNDLNKQASQTEEKEALEHIIQKRREILDTAKQNNILLEDQLAEENAITDAIEKRIGAKKQEEDYGDETAEKETDDESSDAKQENEEYEKLLKTIKSVKEAVEAKTEAFKTEQSTVDSVVTQEIASLERLKEYLELLKTTAQSIFSGNNKKIGFHYGNLDHYIQTGDKSENFKYQGDSLRTGNWGSFGTGIYYLSDPNAFVGSSNVPQGQLKNNQKFYAMDLSKYNLYMAQTSEQAESLYNFLNKLQKFVMSASNYRGFDEELQGVNVESLYKEFQTVFKNVSLPIEALQNFIDKMRGAVAGLDIDENFATFDNVDEVLGRSDNIPTRFMKSLGYQGIDVSGTNWDKLQHGNVVYDLDQANAYYQTFDSLAELLEYYNQNLIQTNSIQDTINASVAQWRNGLETIKQTIESVSTSIQDSSSSMQSMADQLSEMVTNAQTLKNNLDGINATDAANTNRSAVPEKAKVPSEASGRFTKSVPIDDTASSIGIADETTQLNNLLLIINQVKEAVDAKTKAFKEEYVTVDAAVKAEIDALNKLKILLDNIKGSMQLIFSADAQKLGDINVKQNETSEKSAYGALQSISEVLGQIYGVLKGFTGIDAKTENSVDVKKPVDETRLNQDKFTEQDLPVLNSILDAVNGINSYLVSNKSNTTFDGADADNNVTSNIYTLLSSKLSQNLASERTLSEAVSLINLLLDKNKIEKDLAAKATQYDNLQSFVRDNLPALKAIGINNNESAMALWRNAQYNREDFEPVAMAMDDVANIIRNEVPESILDGWFRNGDSDYKPKLENIALTNKDVRNAALNIMWDNYKQFSGKDIGFDEFLHSNIPVYRGKNQENYTDNDKVLSFTFDRSVAESFGKHVLETVIRPIDTIGSYQTTAEGEVMVRKDYLDALPEFQTWLNNMSSGLKESFTQAAPGSSDVNNDSGYALETTLQSAKAVLENILSRIDAANDSKDQQIETNIKPSDHNSNVAPDEQNGTGYALETTLQNVVNILNNILASVPGDDTLLVFMQPLTDAVAALKNVADGIIQHQKAQKSDTRVAQARIEDPAQQDVIRQKAIDTGLKLGSDVQIATLDSLTNGLVRVSGAFKNADGEWEGFTVKVNEANEAVDLAINKQSAFAKSLNKTSEQMADDSNPYIYSKDEVEARAQKHLNEYAAQGKNATVQFKDSGRYTITILEEIDGLSKQIFQTFDENDDKIERTTVTMSNSQKMKLDALQKKLIEDGVSNGLISDKNQIYVDYQKASDELSNMADAYSKLDDVSDDQISKWKQQIALVQQLGSQLTDLIKQNKLESDKKIFESDRSKKLSKFDLDNAKLQKDINIPDGFKSQIDEARKAIEVAADSDALKVAINNWEILKNQISQAAVEQDLYIEKAKGSKVTPDLFSKDLSAQKTSFDKYRKDIEGASGVTDELKTRLQELDNEFKNINNNTELTAWQKKFENLQVDIDVAQGMAKLGQTRQSKQIRGELNSKLKESGLNKLPEDLSADQQEILNKRDELIRQLDEYDMRVKNGQQAEISGIEQTKAALFGLIEAYKQKNNIVDAKGNPSKQAYGTAQLQNSGAKYNSLQSRAQGVDLTGDFNVVKNLTDAYEKLKEAQSKFQVGEDLTTESGKAKVEAFKQAQIEFNRYAQELGKVVKEEEKLVSNSIDTSTPVAEDFQNDMQGRKKALEDFVNSIPEAAIGKFNSDFTELTYTVKNGDGTFTNMTATLNAAGTTIYKTAGETEKATTAFGRFFDELKDKAKGIATYLISMTGFQEIFQQIRQGIQYVIEIDSALTELKKVTDETDSTYDSFLQNMSKTASVVGSTVSELTTMAAEWARLGYSIEDSAKLAESTAILLNVSEFDNATEASQALISTMQAFSYTADESQHVVDVLNEVGNNYAVSSDGLATALQDSASALMEGGNNLEQSVALIAAANKVVQDPNSVGSALRTISLRLRGTSVEVLEEMGEETDGVITSVSKLQSKIKALSGVNILTESGDYKDTYTILKEIGQVWEDMNDIDRAALLELMAGKNRANTLSAILGNMGDLTSAYETAMNAEGSAPRENATYMDSIQGRIDQFNNAVQTMWMNFISSDVVKFIVNVGTELTNLIDKVGLLNTAISTILAVKMFKNESGLLKPLNEKMTNIINKLLGNNIAGAAGESAGAAGESIIPDSVRENIENNLNDVVEEASEQLVNLSSVEEAAGDAANQAAEQVANLGSAQETVGDTARTASSSVNTLRSAQTTQAGAAEGSTGANNANATSITGVGNAAQAASWKVRLLTSALTFGLSLAIGALLQAGIKALDEWITTEEEAAEAARNAVKDSQNLTKESKSLEEYKDQIRKLRESLDSNNLSQSEAYDARQKLLTIQDELINKFGLEKDGINLVTGAIEDQIDAIDELSKEDAQEWLNNNQKSINNAIDYFEDTKFDTAENGRNGKKLLEVSNWNATKNVRDMVSQYAENKNNVNVSGGIGLQTIEFVGPVEEAKAELENFLNWLSIQEKDLRKEYSNLNSLPYNQLTQDEKERLVALQKDIEQLKDYEINASEIYKQKFGEDSTYASNKALIDEVKQKTALTKYSDQYMKILKAQNEFTEAQAKGDTKGMEQALDALHSATAEAMNDAGEWYMDEFFGDLDKQFATEEFELKIKTDKDGLKTELQDTITESGLSALDNNQIKDMVNKGLNAEGAVDESGAYTEAQIKGLIALQTEADNAGISIEALISILTNFGLIAGHPVDDAVKGIESTGKAYSILAESAEKYKDINEVLNESVYNGIKISKDQYEALSELIGSEEEFIDCIDTSDGYIVKDIALTKKLIDGKKEELAIETKLAKSQAQLQYSDVIQSISDQIASTNVLENVNQELVDSLFDQADALRTIINQYQSLEDSLLGATNAFTEFTDAQDMDAQNTYGSTMVEMAQIMYDAIYKTGEVGSAQFWAAVKATVPDDIYAGLMPGDAQINAIKNYLKDNLFTDLTLDGDSFSIDFDSIENFVKKAQSKGLFSGSGIESFGLSSEFMLNLEDGEDALKNFADQMGVTEAYVYAVFSEMDKYNANGAGLSMLFQLDNSATNQLTILNTQLEQALKTGKELMAQGADLTANTADIRFIQSQQAGVKKQITSDTTKYLDIADALNDPTKTVGEALSEELIIEIGLQGKEGETVESVFQEVSNYLLQLEEPTTFDLEISKENVEEELGELKEKIGEEEIEANVTIDTDGTMKVKDGIDNEDLERYVSLYNTNQFIDDTLKSGFTTTETLLSEINKNVATIAGDEPKSEETPSNDSGSSENAHGGEGGNFGGAKREGGNKVSTDKPVELPVVFDIPKALAEAYKEYKDDIAKFAELGFDPNQTKFGNIDTNNRQVLEWDENNLNKYKNELMSWYDDLSWDEIVNDFSGTLSTVMGASSEFFPVEIAFSPILQTENGPVLLDENTVSEYMYGLIDKAGTQFSEGWTGEDLLRLDAEGLEVDGQRIKGLIADVGDTAIQTGEAMHYAGTDGSIAQNFKLIEESATEAGTSVEEMMSRLEDNNLVSIQKAQKEILAETWDKGILMDSDQGDAFNNLAKQYQQSMELKKQLEGGQTINPVEVEYNMAVEGDYGVEIPVSLIVDQGEAVAEIDAATEGATVDVDINLDGATFDKDKLFQAYASPDEAIAALNTIIEKEGELYELTPDEALALGFNIDDGSILTAANALEYLKQKYAELYQTWSLWNSKTAEPTSIKTYSQLQSDVASFNDILTQNEKIIGNNVEVTQEYKDTLAGLLDVEVSDLNEYFDNSTGLIVKNADGLKKLTKEARNNTKQNIKLAKSQAQLEYYDLVKQLDNMLNATNSLTDANFEAADSLLSQINSVQRTILQYQMLEESLLGAANAFREFEGAKEIDSQNTYGDSYIEMAQAIYDAYYKTGEVGSEAVRSAVEALIDPNVYAGLERGSEEYNQAIYDAFNKTVLPTLTLNDDSLSIDFENIEKFVTDGLGKIFTGTGINDFDLVEDLNFDEAAEKMGMTTTQLYAMLAALKMFTGIDFLSEFDNDTISSNIMEVTSNIDDLNREKLALLKDGVTEEEQERIDEINVALAQNKQELQELGAQAYDTWQEYTQINGVLTTLDEVQDKSQKISDVFNSDLIVSLGLTGDETVQQVYDTLLEKKLSLEQPSVLVAKLAIDNIDEQIGKLESALNNNDFSGLGAMFDLKVDKVQLKEQVEQKLTALKEDKAAIALEFNIELTDEKKANLQQELETIQQFSIDDKEFTVTGNTSATMIRLNAVRTTLDKIKDKTISVRTIYSSIGTPPAGGGVGVNGTAHVDGTAFKEGSWGAPKNETALVGELGPEMIVRDGRWFTVGDNGAEFTDIKHDDIIFNHKQTESLLKNGYVTGRGKAFAEGTAYASLDLIKKARQKAKTRSKSLWKPKKSSSSSNSSKKSSGGNSSSSSAKDTADIFDWFEVLLEEINEQLDLMNAKLENAVGISAKNSLLDQIINVNKSKLSTLKEGLDLYTDYSNKLLKEIPEKYRKMAQDGAVAIEEFAGDADKETLEAINNYRDWAQKVADLVQQMEELNTEISTLAKQKIDNIAEGYDNKKSIRDSKIDQYEAYNSLLETDVGFESEKIYRAMMSENKSNIDILQKQRDAMLAELNKQVEAGNIKKYSQDWYDVVNDISAVDTEIIELKTDIEDWQDAINDLHWDKFDLLMDKLNAVSDEADNLIDVLSSKDLVNKDTAEWTDEGITTLGLYAQKMDAAEVQAKKYEEQIKYLNKNWKKLGYTEEEYIDKLEELKNGQYDAIKAYNDTKDAIVDLNKERVEAIKDGIQKEIDAYTELINKKKEELDSEKDLYDFQKSVSEKQKDIAKIQRQLAALAGDNSASARAKRAQLEAELLDAQADLEETYYDRSVSNQQEALDKELESFEDAKNDEMEGWDEYLENTNQVVADSLDVVKANTDAIYQELQTMGQEYGLSITESLTSPWKEGENAIQAFSEKFGLAMSATVDELKKLELEFMETMEKIEKSGSTSVDTVKNNASGYQSAEYKPPKQEGSSGGGSSSGSGSGNGGGGDNGGKSYPYGKASETSGNIKEGARGNQVKAIQYALNQLGYGNSGTKSVDGKFGSGTKSAVRAFQKAMGISADGIVGKNTRAKFRAKGYKFGTTGVDTDQFAWIDEMGLEEIVLHAQDGKLAYLTKGSAVLPHSISENLMKLGQLDPQYMLDINRPQASVSPSIINNTMELSVDNSIGTLISIENFDGNNPDEITKVVNKALEQHTKNLNNALRKFAR